MAAASPTSTTARKSTSRPAICPSRCSATVPGGRREAIHPGNREFTPGDRIARPQGGAGGGAGGGQASNSGEGEDDFVFELSREEFLELFFEDLELPNLVRTQLAKATEFKSVRAGFTSAGNPANLDVVRSMRGHGAADGAWRRPTAADCMKRKKNLQRLFGESPVDEIRAQALVEEIEHLRARVRAVPFIDTFDLRYVNRVQQPQPTTQRGDVLHHGRVRLDGSGAQGFGQALLHPALSVSCKRNYQKIEVVFIRHHTVAKEVDEQEFFYSRETGGTVVSSALQMMADILHERYPAVQLEPLHAPRRRTATTGITIHRPAGICCSTQSCRSSVITPISKSPRTVIKACGKPMRK
jgi:uncharacterized sporulation protein YeaH/YhbH (DUF444 family)